MPTPRKMNFLPMLATVPSLLARHGATAMIALLGIMGVAGALNEAVWVVAIVAQTALAIDTLAISQNNHANIWPTLIGFAA